MTAPPPALSVIVPVRNEVEFIAECVESILDDAPEGGVEVIVVDGESDDGTTAVVDRIAQTHPNVRLEHNPARFVPQAMNIGIRSARAPFIGRIDGHCRVVPGYFAGCLERLRGTDVDCVGGVLNNEGSPGWGHIVAVAQSSPLGVGSAKFRTGVGQETLVDTLAFGVYRREVFERIGEFDERFVRNQDDELNLRLIRSGGRILLMPSLRIRYFVRSSLRQLRRQYYQYGYWKWRVFLKHRRFASWRQVVPSLFLVAVASLLVIAIPFPVISALSLSLVLGSYLAAIGIEAIRSSRRHGTSGWRTALALVTMHVAYGLGLLQAAVSDSLRALGLGRRGAPTEMTR